MWNQGLLPRPDSSRSDTNCQLGQLEPNRLLLRVRRPLEGHRTRPSPSENDTLFTPDTAMARRRRPPRPGALSELPPLKILSQIAALQGLYYAAALVLMLFTALVAGNKFSLDLVFGWETVRGDTTQGWLAGFIWVLDGGLIMCVFRMVKILFVDVLKRWMELRGIWLTSLATGLQR